MQTVHHVVNLPVALSWLPLIPLLVLFIYQLVSKPIHDYLLRRYTTVHGLPALGLKRDQKVRGTAVVCGGR